MSSTKFYFFDTGVVRALQHRSTVKPGTPEFGELFETYICHELKSYIDYCLPEGFIHYWRSVSGVEVDFIINDKLAIEIKASSRVSYSDLKGLKMLQEEKSSINHYILVCLEDTPRTVDNVQILPWKLFLMQLWNDHYNLSKF